MPKVTKLETSLRAAFPKVSDENIKLALCLMRLEVDPRDVPLAASIERPWHSRHTLRMDLLDTLLETHGVECLDGDRDSHSKSPRFEYLNVGDPYIPTVVWYRSSGRYYVRCYGDIVEAYRIR